LNHSSPRACAPAVGIRVRGLDQLEQLGRAQPLTPACDCFYFLRHGQTAFNARWIFQSIQEPLNETGRAQARQAAQRLAHEPLRTIISSDAPRAWETACTVAAAHRIDPLPRPGLRERDFGALLGTSTLNLDWACAPEGGETLPQFMQRTHTALTDALALPAPVLVVAHGGVLHALSAMLGISIEMRLLGNAQPLRFERSGAAWKASRLLE
jgi:probable phosphoglycerate mutase